MYGQAGYEQDLSLQHELSQVFLGFGLRVWRDHEGLQDPQIKTCEPKGPQRTIRMDDNKNKLMRP